MGDRFNAAVAIQNTENILHAVMAGERQTVLTQAQQTILAEKELLCTEAEDAVRRKYQELESTKLEW